MFLLLLLRDLHGLTTPWEILSGDNIAEHDYCRVRRVWEELIVLSCLFASYFAEKECFRQSNLDGKAPAIAPNDTLAIFGPSIRAQTAHVCRPSTSRHRSN